MSGAKKDSVSEEVESGAALHLALDHLDAVDVAFDRAGTVGQGEVGGDGGQVTSDSFGEGA
jgi:hypothetical protein